MKNEKILFPTISFYEPTREVGLRISKRKVKGIMKDKNLRVIAKDYICVDAKVLRPDFSCSIGFHFKFNIVYMWEFFRDREYYQSHDTYDSYQDFQKVFEEYFGKPTSIKDDYSCKWIYDTYEIHHYLYDRFGLEEHLFICQKEYGILALLYKKFLKVLKH
jgi:hypothetical protein